MANDVPRSGQPVCEDIETILLTIPRVNCPDVMAVLAEDPLASIVTF